MLAMAKASGINLNPNYLKLAYRYLLKNQPHDSICGCSSDLVHEDMTYRYSQVKSKSKALEADFENNITSNGEEYCFSVMNYDTKKYEGVFITELRIDRNCALFAKDNAGYQEYLAFDIEDEKGNKIPYEILILCDADNLDDATEIWRWNASGLGYSHNGYAGPYGTAITIDENGNGQINADFITTGILNAQLVTIQNLTATSFQGNEIILGGSEDCKLEVHDTSNPPKTLIRINGSGMECFGETVGGVTPSVVFDKDGVTGYSDSTDRTSKIFWTRSDEFHMKNGVVENELSVGQMLRFVPVTVGSFEGIVIVPVV